jgi:hypothetical protein
MNIFFRILIGLLIAGVGTYFVLRTQTILGFFGPVAWAEAKLGGGGTRLFYKLIGLVLIFTGFMVATNLWGAFLEATLGSLFPRPQE